VRKNAKAGSFNGLAGLWHRSAYIPEPSPDGIEVNEHERGYTPFICGAFFGTPSHEDTANGPTMLQREPSRP
jgi:hypothetical protein